MLPKRRMNPLIKKRKKNNQPNIFDKKPAIV
jgi:hypothetical protein